MHSFCSASSTLNAKPHSPINQLKKASEHHNSATHLSAPTTRDLYRPAPATEGYENPISTRQSQSSLSQQYQRWQRAPQQRSTYTSQHSITHPHSCPPIHQPYQLRPQRLHHYHIDDPVRPPRKWQHEQYRQHLLQHTESISKSINSNPPVRLRTWGVNTHCDAKRALSSDLNREDRGGDGRVRSLH
jgi:hypothetical protein